jgi:hypothetical protein
MLPAMARSTPLRVVQWAAGNVARETVRAVLAREDLLLVGAYVRSAEKAGRDVALLCGLPEPAGVRATRDVDALLALRPDCVVYTPLHFDADEAMRILGAGVNMVTSSEFMTGRNLGPERQRALEAAAMEGGASIFGSGMNPGFAQVLAALASGISRDVRHVRVIESVDVTLFAADANMDALCWGRSPDAPGVKQEIERATAVFAEGLDVAARVLGVPDYEPRCTVETAVATRDLHIPGRSISAGTIAGLEVRWEALLAGTPVIEMQQRWVMGKDIEPAWKVSHGYSAEVAGDPKVRLQLGILPAGDLSNFGVAEMRAIGLRITALPLVQAIPAVCAAPPGIRTYADLPLVAARIQLPR